MTAVTGFLAFTKYAYLLGKNTNTSDTSGMSRREKNFMTLNSYKANESFDTGNSYTNDNYSSNNNSVYGGSVYSGSTYSADNTYSSGSDYSSYGDYSSGGDYSSNDSYSAGEYGSYTGREEYYTGSDTQSNTPVEDSFAANNPGNNIFREYYNNNPESNNSKKENTDSDKITPTRSIIKDVWGDNDKK